MIHDDSESTTSQEILPEAMRLGCTLMRNNSGACLDHTGRLVRYGLGNVSKKHFDNLKSSDYIGITKVVITQEMVGRTLGVFTAIECKERNWNPSKTLDKREIAQNNFLQWVISQGGFAGFANGVDKLKGILRK